MNKETIQRLVLSPILEDKLIGITLLKEANTLEDIKDILGGCDTSTHNKEYNTLGDTFYVRYNKGVPGIKLTGYKFNDNLYLNLHLLGLFFYTKPDLHNIKEYISI